MPRHVRQQTSSGQDSPSIGSRKYRHLSPSSHHQGPAFLMSNSSASAATSSFSTLAPHNDLFAYSSSPTEQISYSSNSSAYSSSSGSSRPQLSSGNTSPPDHQQQLKHNPAALHHFSSPSSKGIYQVFQQEQVSPSHPTKSDFPNNGPDNGKMHDTSTISSNMTPSNSNAGASGNSGAHADGHTYFAQQQQQQQQNPPPPHHPTDSFSPGRGNGSITTHEGVSGPISKSRRTSPGGSRIVDGGAGNGKGHTQGSGLRKDGEEWMHVGKHAPPSSSSLFSSAHSTMTAAPGAVVGSSRGTSPAPVAQSQRTPEGSTSSERLTLDPNQAQLPHAQEPNGPHLDLANYPPQDLLRVLATLLHQIATANDQLRPKGGASVGSEADRRKRSGKSGEISSAPETAMSSVTGISSTTSTFSTSSSRRSKSKSGQEGALMPTSASNDSVGTISSSPSSASDRANKWPPTTAALSALSTPSSTLCFHARNVPSISIESYLLRILKYCPTTNEVFLSLLIYFDRMSRMGAGGNSSPSSNGMERRASGSEDSSTEGKEQVSQRRERDETESGDESGASSSSVEGGHEPHPGMRGFAIDSYNVHRLVIAGITVASKFFSDVFYTNSRYAKVGGLPVHELNQLELQFLLLNDFCLVIPLEEMQRYADQLLIYGGAPRSSTTLSPASASSATPVEGEEAKKALAASQLQKEGKLEKPDRGAAAVVNREREKATGGDSETSRDGQGDVAMRDA